MFNGVFICFMIDFIFFWMNIFGWLLIILFGSKIILGFILFIWWISFFKCEMLDSLLKCILEVIVMCKFLCFFIFFGMCILYFFIIGLYVLNILYVKIKINVIIIVIFV